MTQSPPTREQLLGIYLEAVQTADLLYGKALDFAADADDNLFIGVLSSLRNSAQFVAASIATAVRATPPANPAIRRLDLWEPTDQPGAPR